MRFLACVICLCAAEPLTTTAGITPHEALDLVAARQGRFASLYNSQSFDTIQDQLYGQNALLVYPVPGVKPFLPQTQISSFLEVSYYKAIGVRNLSRLPMEVVVESDNVVHEIGIAKHSRSPQGELYYSRWECPLVACDSEYWKMAFDTMDICSNRTHRGTQSLSPYPRAVDDTITKHDLRFAELFNAKDFAGIQREMFAPSALLIGPEASHPSFLTQPSFAVFFQTQYNDAKVRRLSRVPQTTLLQFGDHAIHEVGLAAHSLAPRGVPYYTRWESVPPYGPSDWQIALDILAIGSPSPAPVVTI